jgi:hypothetical protein
VTSDELRDLCEKYLALLVSGIKIGHTVQSGYVTMIKVHKGVELIIKTNKENFRDAINLSIGDSVAKGIL